jgi:hypothetical protein
MTRTRRLPAATTLILLGSLGCAGAAFAVASGQTAGQAATSTGGQAAGGDQYQSASPPAGEAGWKQLTGFVDDVDEDTGQIVVDGQTLVMPPSPEAFYPRKGQKVTLVYEEKDGQKVIDTFRQEH